MSDMVLDNLRINQWRGKTYSVCAIKQLLYLNNFIAATLVQFYPLTKRLERLLGHSIKFVVVRFEYCYQLLSLGLVTPGFFLFPIVRTLSVCLFIFA